MERTDKEVRILGSGQERIVVYNNDQLMIKFKTTREGILSWRAESHTNTEYELHVMLSGTVSFSAENEAKILGPQDAVLIAPGVYHLANHAEGDLSHFTVLFTIKSPALAREMEALGGCIFFRIGNRIRQLCTEIFLEAKSNRPFRVTIMEALLAILFAEVCRQLKIPDEEEMPEKSSAGALSRAEIIDSFFEKNHTGNLSNETALAERLHISRRQLERVLQKIYGMDFRSKMVDVRLKHAAMLLRTTDMKVGEIGLAVGFSSEGSLYTHFRKHYGMTPLKYRKLTANK